MRQQSVPDPQKNIVPENEKHKRTFLNRVSLTCLHLKKIWEVKQMCFAHNNKQSVIRVRVYYFTYSWHS